MAAVQARTIGNEQDGFSVERDDDTLRVRARGLWSSETASMLTKAVSDACAAAPISNFVLDAVGLKPQRDPGQAALAALMTWLLRIGVRRASLTTDSALTRLQILRIAKERSATGLFQNA